MDLVLDTVSLKHLLRSLKTSSPRRFGHKMIETSLDSPLRNRRAQIWVDKGGGLVGEWSRTCGDETVRSLIVHWDGFGGIDYLEPASKICPDIAKKLRQLGFNDGVDRLILRIAVRTHDKNVVSDDSDFWDPAHRGKRGHYDAPVASLCREGLEVTVLLLASLLQMVR